MLRIGQNRSRAGYVVVIHETDQVLALVKRPVFRAELPHERVGDLEQVHRVEGGVQAFVALVVGAGMQHLVVDDHVIVAAHDLADEDEFRLERFGEAAPGLS